MSRRVWVLAALAGILVVAAAGIWIVLSGSGDDSTETQSPPTAPLDQAVLEDISQDLSSGEADRVQRRLTPDAFAALPVDAVPLMAGQGGVQFDAATLRDNGDGTGQVDGTALDMRWRFFLSLNDEVWTVVLTQELP